MFAWNIPADYIGSFHRLEVQINNLVQVLNLKLKTGWYNTSLKISIKPKLLLMDLSSNTFDFNVHGIRNQRRAIGLS